VVPAESQPRTVLLVDDDAPTRRVISLILRQAGYEFREALSRENALVALEDSMPAVVLMDYMMPGLEPGEFIVQVRARGFGGPIVLCTALNSPPDLPVDGVLLKPFDPDDLLAKLEELLPDA
jgi:two-component system response regulator MtrA